MPPHQPQSSLSPVIYDRPYECPSSKFTLHCSMPSQVFYFMTRIIHKKWPNKEDVFRSLDDAHVVIGVRRETQLRESCFL